MKLPSLGEAGEAVLSYFAAFLGSLAQVDWMHFGACLLLIVRLIHDVPLAVQVIKDKWAEYKARKRG